ncbi:TPA: type 1 fimbrial protein [Klebsiella pneumoniae]|nr:type 1 fimbrial protein [Klebsiella pneumoniae]
MAQVQGQGRVKINGQIIESACTISAEDVYQSIFLGEIPLRTLNVDGKGPLKTFFLHLINCNLDKGLDNKHWRDALVTFDGMTAGNSLFAVQGEAKGIAIRILDANHQTAVVGESMNTIELEPNTTTLKYQLQLVKNKNVLKAGEFFSIIKFMIYYQ